MTCINCKKPFEEHCKGHVIPCCPGKCPKGGSVDFEQMLDIIRVVFTSSSSQIKPPATEAEMRFIAERCQPCQFDFQFVAELERCMEAIDPGHLCRDAWKIEREIIRERRLLDEMSEIHRWKRGEIESYANNYDHIYAPA